jgi:hypothetical protein
VRKPSHLEEGGNLLEQLRAKRDLPPHEERRRIRQAAGASLRDVARELERRGYPVSHTAVRRWETSLASPRESRVAYMQLLEELHQLGEVNE